jgi:hypothetical protein
MHLLDLAADETAFNGQVKAGEREGRPDRGCRLANMLGPIGVDQVLVDELRITVGERVVRHLIHQGATFAGGVGLLIGFQAEARALQGAAGANA